MRGVTMKIPTGSLLLLLLYLGFTTNQRSVSFVYLFPVLIEGPEGPLLFSGVLIAEEVEGVGYKASEDTTTVSVQTPMEAYLKMFLTSACFTDEAYFDSKKQNFQSREISSNA